MAVLGRPLPIPALLILTGEASYALYLVHPFAMRGVSVALARAPSDRTNSGRLLYRGRACPGAS